MAILRVSLANVRHPSSREESVSIVLEAMEAASDGGSLIVCFPECVVPGYRVGTEGPPPDQGWLDDAWEVIDSKAADLGIGIVLGTERVEADGLRITARITNPEGGLEGFQDKVQLDPSEELIYAPGSERRLFQIGDVIFGVVICHEGWRYPETVRWAARSGAHIVFHPHVEIAGSSRHLPAGFADPGNSFHEKAALCRAAENTCYFATVNCAFPDGTSTTSAFVDPDGRLLGYQPHGEEGILSCEIDTAKATGLLAKRFKPRSVRDGMRE